MFDPKNFRLKSVYLPLELAGNAEKQAKKQYMNFSAYIRSLIVEDLKKEDLLHNDEVNNSRYKI